MKKIQDLDFKDFRNFKVGDYVYIPGMYFNDSKSRHGKILETEPFFEILLSTGDIHHSSKHQIFRKLDTEEIKKFEIDLLISKYNL